MENWIIERLMRSKMAVLIRHNGKWLSQDQYNKMKLAEEIMDKRDQLYRELADEVESGEVGE